MADNTKYTIKKGDTGKAFSAVLKETDADTGVLTPYSIPNGSTVNLIMKDRDSGSPKVNAACTIANQTSDPGKVTYAWQSADLDTVGEYDLEFLVTLPDTKPVRFPTDLSDPFAKVVVQPALT